METSAATTLTEPVGPAALRGKKLLIVDDDAEMRGWLRLGLRRFEPVIVEAATGWECLERLTSEGPFDLIVTDVRLPKPDGLCLVASARAVGLLMPVIVISGFGDADLRRSVAQLEDAVLLEKPFELEALVSLASALLEARASRATEAPKS